MYKKYLIPVVLAMVAALAIGGVAYAASQPQNNPAQAAQTARAATLAQQWARRGLGQITVIGDNQFTVQLRNGTVKVILVDEQTRYFDAHGTSIAFADLLVGRWAAGRAVHTADGLLARLVIQLPEGFDPTVPLIRHAGTIANVDLAGSAFTLTTLQGERLTFHVDESTLFMGKVSSLADLQPGMGAVVAAQQRTDGSYQAVRVTARQIPQVDVKAAGRVTSIEIGSFTILGRDGQSHTFQVTPATRFRGLRVRGLRDLQLGMGVGVAAHDAGNGQLQALLVVARGR
jgi:hypothetical protein